MSDKIPYDPQERVRIGDREVTRQDLIDAMIQADIDVNGGENDWYLASLLSDGFAGYVNTPTNELVDLALQLGGDLVEETVLEVEQVLDINAVLQLAARRRQLEGR